MADIRWLLWLNHALRGYEPAYRAALFLSDTGTDVLLLATTIRLWFWPDGRAGADGAPMSRAQSRGRLLAFGMAGMLAYLAASLTAFAFERPRPFVTYLPLMAPPGVFEGLRTFGTFPSDHAALLWSVPIALSAWHLGLGWAWMGMALLGTAARIAVGFHYPSDMLGGAVYGIAAAVIAMAAFERTDLVRKPVMALAAGFSRRPQAVFLYLLLLVGGIEFACHFNHLRVALISLLKWLA